MTALLPHLRLPRPLPRRSRVRLLREHAQPMRAEESPGRRRWKMRAGSRLGRWCRSCGRKGYYRICRIPACRHNWGRCRRGRVRCLPRSPEQGGLCLRASCSSISLPFRCSCSSIASALVVLLLYLFPKVSFPAQFGHMYTEAESGRNPCSSRLLFCFDCSLIFTLFIISRDNLSHLHYILMKLH